MGDFVVSGHRKATGKCIWEDCENEAVKVLDCKKRPVSMSVCEDHAKFFLGSTVIIDDPGEVSIGVAQDEPEEDEDV